MQKVLIVDDDNNFINAILTEIDTPNCSFSVADSISRARSMLKIDNFDLILANAIVPGGNAIKLKKNISKSSPNTKLYFMSSVEKYYNKLINRGEKCFHKYELQNNIGGIFAN